MTSQDDLPKAGILMGQDGEKPIVWGSHLLVGGLEHEFYDFPYIGNVIIPTDELIFFRGVGIPPTSLVKIDMGVYGINVWNKLDIDLVKFGTPH